MIHEKPISHRVLYFIELPMPHYSPTGSYQKSDAGTPTNLQQSLNNKLRDYYWLINGPDTHTTSALVASSWSLINNISQTLTRLFPEFKDL